MIHKTVCACGHDLVTHYRDPVTNKRLSCCGMYCQCTHYHSDKERPTPVLPAANGRPDLRPHEDPHCGCDACSDWEDQRYEARLPGFGVIGPFGSFG